MIYLFEPSKTSGVLPDKKQFIQVKWPQRHKTRDLFIEYNRKPTQYSHHCFNELDWRLLAFQRSSGIAI